MSAGLRKVWIKSLTENLEIILPITPIFKFKEAMNNDTQNLFGFGEINNGMSAKLDRWTCESFFPDEDNNYDFDVSAEKRTSAEYSVIFSRWMKEKQILQFQYYSPTTIMYNNYCQVLGFEHGEKYGTGDVFYTLDFIEYKQLKIDNQNITNADSAEITKSYGSDTYYVAEGDTLITIAAKLYGDSTKWSYIMNKNGLQNPLDIKPGMALKI